MRLRYLHLQNYPPIADIKVCFASGSPLGRDCAIRFVVGVNGSGKSNLLRAVAEVFLALADRRVPPFPVSLVYELGVRGKSDHYTFVLDCPGTKSEAGIWVAEGWYPPDDAQTNTFAEVVGRLRALGQADHFRSHITKGTWPQQPGIAMPKAMLAYSTGDLRPWRSVWSRNQDSQGLQEASDDTLGDERPAGWTNDLETVLEAARQDMKGAAQASKDQVASNPDSFRRPILLDAILLKCALLSVALPQAFKISTNSSEQLVSILRDDKPNALQALLERGGWHHLVSVGFRSRLQTAAWDRKLCETAHDWWLCAGEVVAEPHPLEPRRTVFFDLKGEFSALDLPTRTSKDALASCSTQGEALWALLGGKNATPFELFTRLLELNRVGLFDDVLLRLRRQFKPDAGTELADEDIGVLRYEELSDGEQMVLGRMALFHLLQGQQDALLLLDEPETHFNDKWKREIVDIIYEAIGNTANDVLISTHSAIVLSDVFNNEIVMVQKGGNGSSVRDVNEPTFAADPSALMMTVFGADDSIGKRAQEFIENKLRQATGTTAEIADLERLIARMGSGFYRSELRTLLNTWRGGNA
ncbi:MAG: AAA family ATPase [Candidatus Accumulibacter sp.]|uniref:AAA family ATPase n=1 Tax=Accumulibacter sp. TaxID=2053492 RepID=UPI001A44160D|nr:AAA family ATPase [Accumulibacter sp.]MBL8399499.1 AAA family ATPase [Accumulibacter sp.]MBN8519472.1 AAA family ATPase [Accumulibacter sp.]MBO3712938.1 AAA family ATPase [Accumulibacter sp.]